MAETSKRIEELERENEELNKKLEQVYESNYYFANKNSSLLIDKVIMNEKLEKCKELLRIAYKNIEYILCQQLIFGCDGCLGNWKDCPFNLGEKNKCDVQWVHAKEVEEVLKC